MSRNLRPATLIIAALLGGCQAEFPEGSPFNTVAGRAALQEQVNQDVGAILGGMRRAEDLRQLSTRLRRGD